MKRLKRFYKSIKLESSNESNRNVEEEYQTNEAVNSAIKNLDNFDVVGLLENLGQFKSDIKRMLNMSLEIKYKKTSPAPMGNRELEFSTEIRHMIEDVCKWDYQIYDLRQIR